MSLTMETRLNRLERQNRLLILLVLTLGAVMILGVTRPSGSETLECRQLRVVDSTGSIVAMVGIDDDGSRGLFVYDARQAVRIATVHDASQTAWYALDSLGAIRAGIAHYSHGGSGVAVHGAGTRGAAVLYYKDGGSVTLYDTVGAVVDRMPRQ